MRTPVTIQRNGIRILPRDHVLCRRAVNGFRHEQTGNENLGSGLLWAGISSWKFGFVRSSVRSHSCIIIFAMKTTAGAMTPRWLRRERVGVADCMFAGRGWPREASSVVA